MRLGLSADRWAEIIEKHLLKGSANHCWQKLTAREHQKEKLLGHSQARSTRKAPKAIKTSRSVASLDDRRDSKKLAPHFFFSRFFIADCRKGANGIVQPRLLGLSITERICCKLLFTESDKISYQKQTNKKLFKRLLKRKKTLREKSECI